MDIIIHINITHEDIQNVTKIALVSLLSLQAKYAFIEINKQPNMLNKIKQLKETQKL